MNFCALFIFSQDFFYSGESLGMQDVYPAGAVMHLCRNLLPRLEAEIPEFQQHQAVSVLHLAECLHDTPLQIHQMVDVIIDFIFQCNDVVDGICHSLDISGTADRLRSQG